MRYIQAITEQDRSHCKQAGVALGLICIACVVVLAHHPTAIGHSELEVLSSIRTQAAMDRLVHGALIALLAVLAGLMVYFSTVFTLRRPLAIVAVVLLVLGVSTEICAAAVDGFVTPDVATSCDAALPICAASIVSSLKFSSLLIEYFSRVGLYLVALSTMLWGLSLFPGFGYRHYLPLIGFFSGVAQVVALTDTDRLHPHSLMIILLAQVAWYLAVAASLFTAQSRGTAVKTAAGEPN